MTQVEYDLNLSLFDMIIFCSLFRFVIDQIGRMSLQLPKLMDLHQLYQLLIRLNV